MRHHESYYANDKSPALDDLFSLEKYKVHMTSTKQSRISQDSDVSKRLPNKEVPRSKNSMVGQIDESTEHLWSSVFNPDKSLGAALYINFRKESKTNDICEHLLDELSDKFENISQELAHIKQVNQELRVKKQGQNSKDSLESNSGLLLKNDFDQSPIIHQTASKTTPIISDQNDIQVTKTHNSMKKQLKEKEEAIQSYLEKIDKLKDENIRYQHQLDEKQQQLIEFARSLMHLKQSLDDRILSNQKKQSTIEELQKCLVANENERMAMNQQLQETKGNLRVFCRLKPIGDGSKSVFEIPDQGTQPRMILMPQQNAKPKKFLFDRVFSESVHQSDIYSEIKPFVQSAYDGNAVTIFAYGQTGSGKTFTLQGDEDSHGILPRSLMSLIELKTRDAKIGKETLISISCLEIYNEKLNDLLITEQSEKNSIKIQMNYGAVEIINLSQLYVQNEDEIKEVFERANRNRNVEKTIYNERSSRSHCLYRITIDQLPSALGPKRHGILNIVDLAGCERTSLAIDEKVKTDKAKKIQKEANFINKSLTTLGRFMRMLKESKAAGQTVKLPARETKLTRVLEDCLSNSCQILLFINLCQDEANLTQTKESLNFVSFCVN